MKSQMLLPVLAKDCSEQPDPACLLQGYVQNI